MYDNHVYSGSFVCSRSRLDEVIDCVCARVCVKREGERKDKTVLIADQVKILNNYNDNSLFIGISSICVL